MKVVILGINGLIGNGIYEYFLSKQKIETYGFYRNNLKFKRSFSSFNKNKNFFYKYEKNNTNLITTKLKMIKPNLVINCMGITKHLLNFYPKNKIYNLNSKFPHLIKSFCDENNIRFIQISTDCVFTGKKGNYSEKDRPDSLDLYGNSKALGEIYEKNHLTLRTSTIGFEKYSKRGLLEWFLLQKNECYGYKKAFFSGLPTNEFAEILYKYIIFNPNIYGLYNISSSKISKYELLQLFSKYFKRKINIIPNYSFEIDRSLSNKNFLRQTNYKVKSWDRMVYNLSKYAKKK